LLDLFEATGDDRYLDRAVDAMRWISDAGVPVLSDGSGLGWPAIEEGALHPPFWCHGATGIGRLFLHAWRLDVFASAPDLVHRAARAAAWGARWSAPTLCHGLAGNAELLLDVARWTGERDPLERAHELIDLVSAFAVDSEDGRAWISEAPRQITPDYLVGYAGIALVFLRLACPDRVHLLSRAGFAYRSRDADRAPGKRSSARTECPRSSAAERGSRTHPGASDTV
jgi:lantibiotic modifying enzyme